jgi:hypothetical protein
MMIVIALVAQPSFTTRNGQEGFSDEYLSLISRFQNFGEDVFRWLRDKKVRAKSTSKRLTARLANSPLER